MSTPTPAPKITVWVQAFSDRPHLALQWIDPITGKRRTKSAGTSDRGLAQTLAADLEYELRHGKYAEPSRVPWSDFIEIYAAEKLAGNRPATATKARTILVTFGEAANVKRPSDIAERSISRYVTALRENGRKVATIAGNLAHLKAAIQWAVDHGFLAAMPKIKPPKVPTKIPRTITREQFDAILERAPSGLWRAFLETAWYTGMRRNELLSLVWESATAAPWLDFARSRVIIPAAFNKSDTDQWIPLHPDLAAILLPLQKSSGVMFPLSLSEREVSRKFTTIAKRAGVTCCLHDLRRTFGTRYAPNVPAQVLQRLMRHADIKTTMAFYADLDGALDAAILKG